jgi:hypothetical protein
MPTKDECLKVVRAFRAKHAIDAPDENVIATIHLMNKHGLDPNAALDQSSRAAADHGIDAWYYNREKKELFVYQSKLSDARSVAAYGFGDLQRAQEWLEMVIVNGQLDQVPTQNPCLFNLYTRLSAVRDDLRRVHFVLLSPIDGNELEDLSEFSVCEKTIGKSKLCAFVSDHPGGKVTLHADEYDLDQGVPKETKTYSVERIRHTTIELRKNAHLNLAYLSLFSLVQLYRQRGDVLFDKNVRMSLINNKEAKDRLVNPMDDTLDAIVKGRLSPNIFPFYHIGVTIAASASSIEDDTLITLEAPSIINGCQTIVIANEFLRRLERQKAIEATELFKQIKVIAKVVVGTTNDELKEITNSNNRQNPIENWQLFSNEPVHIEIETALKDAGVFYERQRGKFDSVMKNADNAKHYFATNGTYIRVVDLAQIVALARQNLQWAAKPSDVFINKEAHDKCFDKYVVRNPKDIIFTWNLFRALKRGLNKYLEMPAHANSNAPVIFKKPMVRAHVYSLGILHFYQSDNRRSTRIEFSNSLTKIANARLVDEVQQVFYQKIVARVRKWYTDESRDLTTEVAKKRTDAYFTTLAGDLGIDDEGVKPFTEHAINWREYTSA